MKEVSLNYLKEYQFRYKKAIEYIETGGILTRKFTIKSDCADHIEQIRRDFVKWKKI